ncbi:MAG: hypothetical protein ACR2MY_02330 [Candidatus Dormibacteria bacterium]
MSPTPLTAKSRTALLKRLGEARAAGDPAGGLAARDAYIAALPRLELSRDPTTGEVASRAFDSFDIDGPFWDYVDPARPSIEPVPESVLAVTGALHLAGPAASTEFLVKPGPGAPFVVPRLLELPGVTAVISHVKVGPHDGYPVIYFAKPMPTGFVHFNDWGADRHWYRAPDGGWGWERNAEDLEELDFDLRPWLESKQLRWIAPEDATLRVRQGARGCPYTKVDGAHGWQRIQFGQVSAPEMTPAQRALGPISLPP